jgi:FkbM family methyltransferase
MEFGKLPAFIKLRGANRESNLLIQKEKIRYLFFRLLGLVKRKNLYSLGERLTKPVLAKSNGLFYCREKSLDLHIISDSYEFKVKEIFEKLCRESKIIVDIGANIGRYTILGGNNNPRAKIYSIEPEEDNFNILSKNVKLNNLKNVELIKTALGNQKGEVKLYKSKGANHGGHSILNKTDNFELVKLNTLDALIKDKVNEIDLIKIDVEGFELDVLSGMKNFLLEKRIKNILIEIDKENYSAVVQFAEKYGYSIKWIMYNNYLISHK